MPTYAHVADDRIVELFTPPPGVTIEECFHPGLIWVDITGRDPQPQPGWSAVQQGGIWVMMPPVIPAVTLADRARGLLNSSVQIESVSDSTLNGSYAVDAETRSDIMAEIVSLATNGTFTDAQTDLIWPDINGKFHVFDAAHFRSYATAVGAYITTLKRIAAGAPNALPDQPIRIM